MNPYDVTPNYLKTPSYLNFNLSKYSTPRSTIQQPTVTGTRPSIEAGVTGERTAAKTQPKTTGVSVSKSGSQPKTQKTGKSAEQKYQENLRKEISNAYQEQINFLTGQEQALQSQLPTQLEEISTTYEGLRPGLESQLAFQQESGAQAQEGLKAATAQNLASIRRGAEEQGLRAVQQFGGVAGSSAGQAAAELIAREQLRSQGAAQMQQSQGIQNIQQQLRTIQAEYDSNINKLNLEKERALQTARNEFNKQLESIRASKMQAGVTKANQTISALQDFATRRRAIEDQSTSLANNLTILKQQAESQADLLRLQSSLQAPATNNIAFGTLFPANSNQSKEAAKTLQAIINSGRPLSTFGITPIGRDPETGENLFQTSDLIIIDTKGNRRSGLGQQQESQTGFFNFQ